MILNILLFVFCVVVTSLSHDLFYAILYIAWAVFNLLQEYYDPSPR